MSNQKQNEVPEHGPKQYNNIWDAIDGFEIANKEMHGGPVPEGDAAYLPQNIRKNYPAIRMAAAERGAKWMRDVLNDELSRRKEKIYKLSADLRMANARIEHLEERLKRISDFVDGKE
jgi:hypothetical protein